MLNKVVHSIALAAVFLGAAAAFLFVKTSVSSAALGGPFVAGDRVTVTVSLRVRREPLFGGTLKVEPAGATGTILAVGKKAGGYTWYKVKYANAVGWSAGEYLTK